MVEIPPQATNALKYVASFFAVRSEWLLWPNILTVFIVPYILNIVMIYLMLQKVIRIFPGSVNIIIGALIGFLMLPYNGITSLISPAIIGWFATENLILKIILIAFLYALYFLILPFLVGEVARFPLF